MKHNLKNRPMPGCYKGDPEEAVIKAYRLWFDGFEKELRKELREFESTAKQRLPPYADAFNAGVCQVLRKILGEEKP